MVVVIEPEQHSACSAWKTHIMSREILSTFTQGVPAGSAAKIFQRREKGRRTSAKAALISFSRFPGIRDAINRTRIIIGYQQRSVGQLCDIGGSSEEFIG